MIVLRLDGWHAVPKARPRVTARGTFMPPGYMDWKQETAILLRKAHKAPPLEGILEVRVWIAATKKPRGDVDNLLGAVLDAGNGVVWVDDRTIGSAACSWVFPSETFPEGLVVEVETWNPRN